MDMVERVARALCLEHAIDSGYSRGCAEASVDVEWKDWVVEACAAIAAMQGAVLDFANVYESKGLVGDAETIRVVADELMSTEPQAPSSE